MRLAAVLSSLCVVMSLTCGGQQTAAPPNGAVVPNKVCADCHDKEDKLKSSGHARVACASCHLNHQEYPHPEKQPKPACVTCHAQVVADYQQSEHAQQMKKGNGAAPECATCHGDAHELPAALSADFRRKVPETCGMCHDKPAEQYAGSVHGKAVAAGRLDAPVCSDCHGGHRIQKHDNPTSTVSAASVPGTCGRCHGDVRLMKRFGLPADRLTSFNSSFHGLALKAGNQSVAGCASCHGFHDILPSSDPKSRTNQRNLATTCGACHPGAGSRFAISTIHEAQGENGPLPLRYAQLFYALLIPATIGFMLLHHGADFVKKLSYMRFRGLELPLHLVKPGRVKHERMYKMERVEHALLTVSFLALVYTGFALHYPDDWWAKPLLGWEQRFPVRGTIHRTAGVVLILTSILHIVTLVASRRLRRHWMELLPRFSDAREMLEGTLWRLGLRPRPKTQPHGYVEKLEYWALVWGTIVMAATGTLLWANNWTMTMMPKLWIDLARSVHFYEAVLATLAILVWHFYTVIFDPDVYPMDTAWLTGFSPRPEPEPNDGER